MSINDSKNFNVDLDNYQGPLDILLDQAIASSINNCASIDLNQ